MFMPDYGTVQLLHKQRVAEMERKERGQMSIFSLSAHRSESLIERVRRWTERRQPAHLSSYHPARLNN